MHEFLDAELLIYKHLKAKELPIYTYIPKERPDEFITLERVGGSMANMAQDQVLMSLHCWSSSRSKAAKLAYKVDALMRALPEEVRPVCKVQRTGFTNYPDISGHPRYQLLFTLLITT